MFWDGRRASEERMKQLSEHCGLNALLVHLFRLLNLHGAKKAVILLIFQFQTKCDAIFSRSGRMSLRGLNVQVQLQRSGKKRR